ncbi:MAG: DNA-binding protein Alba [Candidatus Bathyarchaeia archaeon]
MAQKKQKKPKEEKEKEKPEKKKVTEGAAEAENAVMIGRKPVMNYVVACITFFNSGEKEVVVKARGRAISRAVDTVELLRRAFVKDLEVKSIDIDTQQVTSAEGQARNVSTMEITLAKAKS